MKGLEVVRGVAARGEKGPGERRTRPEKGGELNRETAQTAQTTKTFNCPDIQLPRYSTVQLCD